jgi:hypothetical protein
MTAINQWDDCSHCSPKSNDVALNWISNYAAMMILIWPVDTGHNK